MKYLFVSLFFLIASYLFVILNFYSNDWLYIQPLLIASLLVYYNTGQEWLHYTFALLAGLFIDSLSGVFGLHAIIFITIIFILRTLQLTKFTSKNILTIILLTALAFVLFWLLFFGANFIFKFGFYYFSASIIRMIIQGFIINILITIVLHILFFNFWLRKHEKQSF